LGVATRTLDAEQLRELLRDTGDVDGEGKALPDSWAGAHRTHCSLAARLDHPEDWHRLLTALAGTGMDRTVAAVTVARTARGAETRAAVRLVSGAAQRAVEGRDRLITAGAALALTGAQPAGLVATLPLAHPARPLEAATGFAPETGRRPQTTGAR
ncbi:hypothetical protein GTW37_16835, partial [Streptomyces sp. SID4931]